MATHPVPISRLPSRKLTNEFNLQWVLKQIEQLTGRPDIGGIIGIIGITGITGITRLAGSQVHRSANQELTD